MASNGSPGQLSHVTIWVVMIAPTSIHFPNDLQTPREKHIQRLEVAVDDGMWQAMQIRQCLTSVQSPTHCQAETWLEETIDRGNPLPEHVGPWIKDHSLDLEKPIKQDPTKSRMHPIWGDYNDCAIITLSGSWWCLAFSTSVFEYTFLRNFNKKSQQSSHMLLRCHCGQFICSFSYPQQCDLTLHPSVSTSWFSSSSVSISGSAESMLAPRSFTRQGWLIPLRMVISFTKSFRVFSLLSASCSWSTFSCFAATKLPFQLAMDTVLLQVVQSSFFTMTSLGSTSKDRSPKRLEIDAELICLENSSWESRRVRVLAELRSPAVWRSQLHSAAGPVFENSGREISGKEPLSWPSAALFGCVGCTSSFRSSALAIVLQSAPMTYRLLFN